MKRNKLLSHLIEHECYLKREGGNHSLWSNPKKSSFAPVPRHSDISERTVFEICKQLGISKPKIN